MRRSSRCSSFPKRALPPLPGLSLLFRSLLEPLGLLALPDPLGGREDDEEDGLSDLGRSDLGLSDEDLLGGRDEDGLSEDDGLPEPLGGREELELLLGLSDPDLLGVSPDSLTI